MNTWKRPKLTQQEKEQLKKCSTPTEHKGKLQQIHKQKAITWTSINNKINRQIDYIVINQRFRNCVKRAQTITGWEANMQQEKQHNEIHMQLHLRLVKNYRKNAKPDTGTNITYNVQDLKLYPGKLKQHMELKEKHTNTTKNCPKTKLASNGKQITNALKKLYPYEEKTQQEKDNDWIMKQAEWSQPNERQTMEYLINKRRALQTRLGQLTRKTKHSNKK